MFRKKWVIAVIVIIVLAAMGGAYFYFKKEDAVSINVEAAKKRDLEAIVTASGTIQAKRFVNMSAVQMGRVTRLGVEEGDRVKAGQFLLEIDPNALRGTVQRGEASVAGARAGLEQAKVNVETARANLALARDQVKRQRDLWAQQLTTRENLDKAESELKVRETELAARQSEVGSREQMIKQEAASLDTSRYNLRQVTLVAPFDGIVTRRNIEEGENVVVGTMNNAGTQLLTVADMSIIEAEVEVDETDIPSVQLGQIGKITIDALPDQTFMGKVTEIGNSPIQQTTHGNSRAASDQLQGDRAARPADSASAAGVHVLGVDHDGEEAKGAVGADPGDGRARGCPRREGPDRARASRPQGQAAEAPGAGCRGGAGRGAQARPDAQGDRGRLRVQEQRVDVRAGEGRHRRRQVLRGAVGAEGRRSGDHGPVQFGPESQGRRRGQSWSPSRGP